MVVGEIDRIPVMILTAFTGLNQGRHQLADNRRILELVAAGADSNIEAIQIRAVIDRYPVIGDIIQAHHPPDIVGDSQSFKSLRHAQGLCPCLI